MICCLLFAVLVLSVVTPSFSVADNGYGVACTPDIDGYGCESKKTPPAPTPTPVPGPATTPHSHYHIPHTTYQPSAPTPTSTTAAIFSTSSNEENGESVSTVKPKCGMHPPEECVFPFVYKHIQYWHCTGVDTVNAKWCSIDKVFAGRWRQCTNPCHKVPVAQILTGVVATGVAATGVGLIAAALHNKFTTTTTTSWLLVNVKSCILAAVPPVQCTVNYPCLSAAKAFCVNEKQDVGANYLNCGRAVVIQNGMCITATTTGATKPPMIYTSTPAQTTTSIAMAPWTTTPGQTRPFMPPRFTTTPSPTFLPRRLFDR